MKNYKTSRILVLVLSLALLIGTAVGFAVSAAETTETTPEIEAINVYYKDVIYVAIAVDTPVEADAAADPEITVKYVIDGEEIEKNATYVGNQKIWEKNAEKNDQNYYPVYVTEGIAAKNQGDDVTAWIVDANGESAKKNVSVASYLYQRLYKDGFIAATEETEVAKRDFYLAHLDYIAGAQKVLYNNATPAPETPKTLVTDYIAVYAEDAKINSGDSFLLNKSTLDVELTYTGEGTKTAWNVTTYDDNGVATTKTVTSDTVPLTSSAVISPVVLGFEIGTPTIVETFDSTTYKQNMVTIADGTQIDCPSFGSYVTTAFPTSKTNTTGEAVAQVVEYTMANGEKGEALQMYSPGRINKDGSNNSNNRSHSMAIRLMESVVPADKVNAVALEFDLKLGLTIPEGSCAKGVLKKPVQVVLRYDQNNHWSYIQINPVVDVTTKVLSINGAEIADIDSFVRIKMVVDIDDKLVHIYANGEFVKSITPASDLVSTGAEEPWAMFAQYGITTAQIGTYNDNGMTDVYVDNLSFYNTYCLD